jgi:multidrug efflux pump subunit AcrA (membrane-fusion protein)
VIAIGVGVATGLYAGSWEGLLASAFGARGDDGTAHGSKSAAHSHGPEDDHGHAHDEAPGHGHDHAADDDGETVRLSPQARRNIGLKVGPVALRDYQRTITLPAIVVERPGRTTFRVAAPLTGVITDVFAASGEAVEPGDLLFILRLTHEDLVQAQTEFLKTLEALDVENREIERLENITQGVVAGKVVLERKYEKQKLTGLLKAQREALLLHGLDDEQVDEITNSRRLLRELRVTVPDIHDETDDEHLRSHHGAGIANRRPAPGTEPHVSHDLPHDAATADTPPSADPDEEIEEEGENEEQTAHSDTHPLVLQDLRVDKGDFVEAGATLASLFDLHALYLEGRAFEQDAARIAAAAQLGQDVTALPDVTGVNDRPVEDLHIVYVANEIETQSRALPFYVNLPNEIVRDARLPDGRRFVTWRFKPGQRMRLRIPIESWPEQVVVPINAIAADGVESFVFVKRGDLFERRSVHLLYRDQTSAVLANDGTLTPGQPIALSAAHQLQMALENKSSQDPTAHVGHTH